MAEDGLGEHRGAVVAIDPSNGDVLALASNPGFDPTLFARGISRSEYAALQNDIDKPLFNRALRGTYPSGSTIKPVIGLAALTDHTIDGEHQGVLQRRCSTCPAAATCGATTRTSRGAGSICRKRSRAPRDVYFYGLASTLGIDRMVGVLAPFGYGQLTGIDISGEKAGPAAVARSGSARRSSGRRTRSGSPARRSTWASDRATCW